MRYINSLIFQNVSQAKHFYVFLLLGTQKLCKLCIYVVKICNKCGINSYTLLNR